MVEVLVAAGMIVADGLVCLPWKCGCPVRWWRDEAESPLALCRSRERGVLQRVLVSHVRVPGSRSAPWSVLRKTRTTSIGPGTVSCGGHACGRGSGRSLNHETYRSNRARLNDVAHANEWSNWRRLLVRVKSTKIAKLMLRSGSRSRDTGGWGCPFGFCMAHRGRPGRCSPYWGDDSFKFA